MLTSVKLVDGDREMILLPRQDDGILLQELTAPMPAVRDVVEQRTDDDGERDTTSLHGARACTVELLVTANPRRVEDELTRYLHPRVRPYLVVTDDEWTQARRLRLRVDQFDAPYGLDLARFGARSIQVQWRAPDGIWEADDLTTVPDISADIDTGVGLDWPVTFPVSWPATTATGAANLVNLGSIPSHFVARLYGPCTAPRLVNETTDEEIAFTESLVLAAGEYVEVDTRARTAFLLSMPGSSRLNMVDFAATSWWRIEPGEQRIRYAPSTASAGAAAVIDYRPAWL